MPCRVPVRSLMPPLLAALLLGVAGCDSGSSPVAPTGTTLAVSANPTRIGVTGTSQITVLAHETSGAPVRTGTEIRFTTTLGSIEEVVRTDPDGVARAVLRADGRPGDATVSVSSGTATPAAALTVGIGPPDMPLAAEFTPTVQGLTVIFSDASTGNPTAWEWNFGDGATSTTQNPNHGYAAPGVYVVTLTVRTAVDEDSHSEFVTVQSASATGVSP